MPPPRPASPTLRGSPGTALRRSPSSPASNSKPKPEASLFTSGAGVFRTYAQNPSKYLDADPLNYEGAQAHETFSLGLNKNSGGHFRTVDISRINEQRYKWNRLDTFQTALGHVSDAEGASQSSPKLLSKDKGCCSFQPSLLQDLEADLFDEFHSCMESLASHVVGDVSEQLQALREEMLNSMEHLKADVRSVKGDADTRGIAASSHEAHRYGACKSGADIAMGDVIDEVRAGSLAILESLKQMSREGPDIPEAGMQSAPIVEEMRGVKEDALPSCIDLSPVLEAIREMSQRHESSIESIRSNINANPVETTQLRADVDFGQVLQAFDEHAMSSMRVLEDIRQCNQDVAFSKLLEAFEEHDRNTRAAFGDISKTVLKEVRKGWVEVGSLFGGGQISEPGHMGVTSPKSCNEADISKVLQAFDDHAAASMKVLSDRPEPGGQGGDFSVVLDAIRDIQNILCGSDQTEAKLDFSEVVEATEKLRRDVKKELAAMKTLLCGAPSAPSMRATVPASDAPMASTPSGRNSIVVIRHGQPSEGALPDTASGVSAEALSCVQESIVTQVDESTEQLQKKVSNIEERILSKVSAEHKLAKIEMNKMMSVLDGINDMFSSQLDLSPVLEAIAKLDTTSPRETGGRDLVFRAVTDVGTSVAAAHTQLSKLPTEDDFIDLRQVISTNLRDLEVNCEQLQEKVDNLEERLIARMSSNHKVAMFELQKATNASMLEATGRRGSPVRKDGLVKASSATPHSMDATQHGTVD